MQITMGGKYQTRDGRAVRLLMTDMKRPESPVVGLIISRDGLYEFVATWSLSGLYYGSSFAADRDLIPVPTKHEMWFTFDEHFVIEKPCFETFGAARANAVRSGSNVAHVTWED